MYHTILCPYDQSEFAVRALDRAARMAADKSGTLVVVNVLVNPFMFDGGSHLLSNNVMAIDLMSRIRTETETEMAELKTKLQTKFPTLEIQIRLVENNDIGDAILTEAEKLDADLIVMGSHGRKGLRRLVMGSVAEYILREAKCPVMIVK
jgi:nucleotide-binding universal stress UspA family protein